MNSKKIHLPARFCMPKNKIKFQIERPLVSSHRLHTETPKAKTWLWSPQTPKTPPLFLTLSCPGSGTLSLWRIRTSTLLPFFFNSDDFCFGGFDFRSIKKALEKEEGSELDLTKLLSDCFATFKDNPQYRKDLRFLKICFLYVISFSWALHMFDGFASFAFLTHILFTFNCFKCLWVYLVSLFHWHLLGFFFSWTGFVRLVSLKGLLVFSM